MNLEQQIRTEIIPQLEGLVSFLWDKGECTGGRKLDRLIVKLETILGDVKS